FMTALIPEQRAVITENGLLVTVDGTALFKINKTIHAQSQILGGQVHTHPTTAYHSSTDDHFPLVTLVGALSVVLPNFARNAPDDVNDWAWYRLVDYRLWEPLTADTEVIFE